MRASLPEIRLASLNYTVGHWLLGHREDFIDLNAPYQRGSIWTTDQRRALIKSLHMGLPVGAVIVSKLPFRAGVPYHYRVIDGKQRIETVRAFAADEFAVPGWWFSLDLVTTRDRDVTFSDFTDWGKRRLDMSTPLPALEFDAATEWLGRDDAGKNITRARSDEEILTAEAEVYLLVNGGGTAQTDEDMARAAEVASR